MRTWTGAVRSGRGSSGSFMRAFVVAALLAAIAAPWVSPQVFQGSDIIWWIDNVSAMSSLVRGAAKPEDIDLFASVAALQFAALGSRPWYEWVDSDSSPSDGLSRDGVQDSWTSQQGWDLVDLGDFCWDAVFVRYDILRN